MSKVNQNIIDGVRADTMSWTILNRAEKDQMDYERMLQALLRMESKTFFLNCCRLYITGVGSSERMKKAAIEASKIRMLNNNYPFTKE